MKTELKVPGGKLIRVECTVKGDKIAAVKITGDFFMHPEEAIRILEKNLIGSAVSDADIERCINESLSGSIIVVGASAADFVSAVKQAVKQGPDTV